jgi:CHAT domain-containing protein
MNALQSDAIVHVSSHAAIDPERPLFSYVAVNAGERTDRFEVHDVFATHVRAPLVYLSGCETALGMAAFSGVDSGDDVATFNRAFLSAGARGVVATLWRIEDQSAAVMAASFYRYLDGHDAATALAYAQRAMLRSSRYQQPFFWAAYTFSGDVSLKRGQS